MSITQDILNKIEAAHTDMANGVNDLMVAQAKLKELTELVNSLTSVDSSEKEIITEVVIPPSPTPSTGKKYASNYERALDDLGDVEGGYGNDPDDPGGETLYGWARKMNPQISFWPKVDAYKKKYGGVTKECIKAILADTEIKQISRLEYKKMFWDVWGGDTLPYSLAAELFEQSVNLGCGGATRLLQIVLNAMNYTTSGGVGGYGADLKVDGDFGDNTRKRMVAVIKDGYAKALQFGINCEQGASYRSKAEAATIKRKYYKGWLSQRCGAVFEK